MLQNSIKISLTVLPVSLVKHLQIFKKMWFICNDEYVSENNRNNEGGIGRCEINCSKHYESYKSNRFYKALCRFNIL